MQNSARSTAPERPLQTRNNAADVVAAAERRVELPFCHVNDWAEAGGLKFVSSGPLLGQGELDARVHGPQQPNNKADGQRVTNDC